MAAYAFAILDRGIVGLVVAPLKAELQISNEQVGEFGFAFGILYSLIGIPLGLLADRGSRRLLLAAGIAVWSLATMGGGLATGFGSLFAARLLVGVGEASVAPAATSLIPDLFPPKRRGFAFGVYTAGTSIGVAISYLIAAVALDSAAAVRGLAPETLGGVADWRIVFFIAGAPGLLVALLILAAVREPQRRGMLAAGAVSWRLAAAVARRNAAPYATLTLSAVLVIVCIYAQLAWFPSLFVARHGGTMADLARTLALFSLTVGVASPFLGGAIMARRDAQGRHDGPLRLILIHALTNALCGPVMVFAADPLLVWIAYGAVGLASVFTTAAALAALARITPNELRGVVAAAYTLAVGLISIGVGPWAVGLMADTLFAGTQDGIALGLSTVFVVCGVGAAGIVLAGWRAVVRTPTV